MQPSFLAATFLAFTACATASADPPAAPQAAPAAPAAAKSAPFPFGQYYELDVYDAPPRHAVSAVQGPVAAAEKFLILAIASTSDDMVTTARKFERGADGVWRQVGGAFQLAFSGAQPTPQYKGWLREDLSRWCGLKQRVYVLTTAEFRKHLASPMANVPVPQDFAEPIPALGTVVPPQVKLGKALAAHRTPLQVMKGAVDRAKAKLRKK